MRHSKHIKRVSLICITLGIIFLFLSQNHTKAEQVNGSPESNATSRLQSLANDLTTLGFGSATNSPDWGSSWNRIKTAAKYTPSGSATVSDVVSGKTFSDSTRNTKTGTYLAPIGGCSTQQYNNDNGAPVTETTNCSRTWGAPNLTVTGDDALAGRGGKDPVTTLIWSQALLNSGGHVAFSPTTNSTWSWNASGANNIAVGNQTALQLCSNLGNGWRLPTQFELMQAAIDGAWFNMTQPGFSYWAATQANGGAVNSWAVALNGFTNFANKNTALPVRCVRSGS